VKIIGYARVSTDQQAERGVSLEAQDAKLRAYAALHDLELVGIEVDAGESASTLERPGLQRALAALRRRGGPEGLLVVKLDRLTRSVRDLGDLVDRAFKKRALLSVGEQIDTRTAAGLLVLNLLTSVGQWERQAIGERTRAALSHLRAQGRRTSGIAPYGYGFDQDGALLEVPAELAIAGRARAMRARGLSLRAISSALEEAGVVSRGGRPFAPQTLAGILARPG
jgi:site-specific DNA recombinase